MVLNSPLELDLYLLTLLYVLEPLMVKESANFKEVLKMELPQFYVLTDLKFSLTLLDLSKKMIVLFLLDKKPRVTPSSLLMNLEN